MRMGIGYTNDDELDLAWYHNEAAGDLGMPSSFGAMVARLQLGKQTKTYATSEQAEDHMERRLDAARRLQRVESALLSLSQAKQKTLEDAFEHCECPRELVSKPRQYYKAARSSHAMREFLSEMGSRTWTEKMATVWLCKAERPGNNDGVAIDKLDALRDLAWAQAETTYDTAVAEYAAASRGLRHEAERVRLAKIAKSARGFR